MDFDLAFVCNSFSHQKVSDWLSVITLKLDNLSIFFILNDGSITSPVLFEMSQQFLEINVLWKTLNQSKTLSCSTLLELDMNHVLFSLSSCLTDVHNSIESI